MLQKNMRPAQDCGRRKPILATLRTGDRRNTTHEAPPANLPHQVGKEAPLPMHEEG